MIVTSQNFSEAIKALEDQSIIFVDCETTGLNPFSDNVLCGIGLGLANGDLLYFPFRHVIDPSNFDLPILPNPISGGVSLNSAQENLKIEYLKILIKTLNSIKIVVGYNLKFDLKFLIKEGFDFSDKELIDVIVLVRMTEKDRFAKLALTSVIDSTYGEHSGDYDRNTKTILKKQKWIKNFALSPIDVLGPYCEQDVYWTRRLYFDRLAAIHSTNQDYIWNLEKKLTKALLKTELKGISLDLTYCKEKVEVLQKRQKELEARVWASIGYEFNLGSNLQIGKAFNSIGIKSSVVSKAGNQSWDEIVLAGIDHSMAGQIREWRTLDKMKNTYLMPFIESGGELHGTFCNWGTITGRLSSRDPNLQNIPRFMIPLADMNLSPTQKEELLKRIEAMLKARRGGQTVQIIGGSSLMSWGFTGDEHYDDSRTDILSVRRAFVSRPGFTLVSFDYSQMEIRVFLSYLNNPSIIELMKQENFDFHTHAAKLAFNVEESNPDFKFYRQMAKAITFGVIYGIGLERLSMQLGTTVEEAKKYKEKYFFGLRGARDFIYGVQRKAKERGYTFNRFKRRYWPPEDREYVLVNYLVQGTSADILSEGMIKVDEYLTANTNDSILLQVHDELICEIETKHLISHSTEIKRILEDNSLKIPLKIDVATCFPSWAHKKDLDLAVA